MYKIQDAVAATIDITTDTTWSGVTINPGDVVNVLSGATLTMVGANSNLGTINVNSGGRLLIASSPAVPSFVNHVGATINVNSGGVFEASSTLAISYGRIFVNAGGILDISGTLETNVHPGKFPREGILDVNSGGRLIVSEGGLLRNIGTLNINPGGEVTDSGNILVLGLTCEDCHIGQVNVMAGGRLFVMGRGELIANFGFISIHGIVSLSSNAHLALGGVGSSLTVEPGGTLRVSDAGVVIVGPGTNLTVYNNGLFQCTSEITVQGGDVRGGLTVYDGANLKIGTEDLHRGLLFLTQGGVVRIHGTAIVHDHSYLNVDLGSTFAVYPSGILVVQSGGAAAVATSSTLDVNGGRLDVYGVLNEKAGGKVILGSNGGLLTVLPSGKVNINSDCSLTINSSGKFQNTGITWVFGELRINTGGTLNNPNTGEIDIQCGGIFVREPGSIVTGNPPVDACH
jgi:hypothetical protein